MHSSFSAFQTGSVKEGVSRLWDACLWVD